MLNFLLIVSNFCFKVLFLATFQIMIYNFLILLIKYEIIHNNLILKTLLKILDWIFILHFCLFFIINPHYYWLLFMLIIEFFFLLLFLTFTCEIKELENEDIFFIINILILVLIGVFFILCIYHNYVEFFFALRRHPKRRGDVVKKPFFKLFRTVKINKKPKPFLIKTFYLIFLLQMALDLLYLITNDVDEPFKEEDKKNRKL